MGFTEDRDELDRLRKKIEELEARIEHRREGANVGKILRAWPIPWSVEGPATGHSGAPTYPYVTGEYFDPAPPPIVQLGPADAFTHSPSAGQFWPAFLAENRWVVMGGYPICGACQPYGDLALSLVYHPFQWPDISLESSSPRTVTLRLRAPTVGATEWSVVQFPDLVNSYGGAGGSIFNVYGLADYPLSVLAPLSSVVLYWDRFNYHTFTLRCADGEIWLDHFMTYGGNGPYYSPSDGLRSREWITCHHKATVDSCSPLHLVFNAVPDSVEYDGAYETPADTPVRVSLYGGTPSAPLITTDYGQNLPDPFGLVSLVITEWPS